METLIAKVPILAELPGRASEVFPSTGHGGEMP